MKTLTPPRTVLMRALVIATFLWALAWCAALLVRHIAGLIWQ